MKQQKASKSTIKNYWEELPPQIWYSRKKPFSLEYFNEIAYRRYFIYNDPSYPYGAMEYEYHYGEKVLEIGVGVGTDFVQYAKNGAKVYGIDLTENAIHLTRDHLAAYNLKAESLQVADAEKLPFKDNFFDLVSSFGVIHHTPRIDKAVKEIHRVLKPEGKFIVMIYAKGLIFYWIKKVLIHGILKGGFFKYGITKSINNASEVMGGCPVCYHLSRRQIKKLFSEFDGLSIERYRIGYQIKEGRVPEFLHNIIDFLRLERIFGHSWIVKGYKRSIREKKSSFAHDFFEIKSIDKDVYKKLKAHKKKK